LAKINLHLVCNAHLDPVWQWEWPEAAAEAISTFRVAADFCEEFDGFIFNHNEALLYRWVELYDLALFKRIQKLVRAGKWQIIGGWYLQPDCNMPSGEALVRQILVGKNYFRKKFGVEIKTAVNFDSFGHSRGLVQILAKSGYDSYIFGRPDQKNCTLPADDFVWVGYDNSTVMAHRSMDLYSSQKGEAAKRIQKYISAHNSRQPGLVLWGIGNHGGGPSREDLLEISNLKKTSSNVNICHSTPEAYFNELKKIRKALPKYDNELHHCFVGCYNSMSKIKQGYRLLENAVFSTEKVICSAWLQGLMEYPEQAIEDLLFVSFHDAITGTSVPEVEKQLETMLGHGLKVATDIQTKALFALSQSQAKARQGITPIMVYNPHPFAIEQQVVLEISPAQINFSGGYMEAFITQNNKAIESQTEQPSCNFNLDARKRIVFRAHLEPGQINRFDCELKKIEAKPKRALKRKGDAIVFSNSDIRVVINCRTGLIDEYKINGTQCIAQGAFGHAVFKDTADSWASRFKNFRVAAGKFKLMSLHEGTIFSGIEAGNVDSVRVIEDGKVRSIVEAVFAFNNSRICQRYIFDKNGTEIEVETRVFWNEKDHLLKLLIPLPDDDKWRVLGQSAYGHTDLTQTESELVAQKWQAVVSKQRNLAITCINDSIYGFDFPGKDLRLTLLRSSAYCAMHCCMGNPKTIVPLDRFTPRMDQGEHVFRFWINAGKVKQRLEAIEREAIIKNEPPKTFSYYPSGTYKKRADKVLWSLDDKVIVATALKKAENDKSLIIRLFEPTGTSRSTVLSLPLIGKKIKLQFGPFEIKTIKVGLHGGISQVDLLEKQTSR